MIEIEGENSFHVVNYNTPGATGAPAYSAFVGQKITRKGNFRATQKSKKLYLEFQ